jgi:Putative bacterial sensory transduction regulator
MLRAMSDLLSALHTPLAEEVSGLEQADEGLRGQLDLRYGLLSFQIDHAEDAEVLRVAVRLPPPVGAGPEFLIWLLALNAESWTAKLGLDESGFLLVHVDLPVPAEPEVELLRDDVTESIDEIAQIIDEHLCNYLFERSLGTPAQLERWSGESE